MTHSISILLGRSKQANYEKKIFSCMTTRVPLLQSFKVSMWLSWRISAHSGSDDDDGAAEYRDFVPLMSSDMQLHWPMVTEDCPHQQNNGLMESPLNSSYGVLLHPHCWEGNGYSCDLNWVIMDDDLLNQKGDCSELSQIKKIKRELHW